MIVSKHSQSLCYLNIDTVLHSHSLLCSNFLFSEVSFMTLKVSIFLFCFCVAGTSLANFSPTRGPHQRYLQGSSTPPLSTKNSFYERMLRAIPKTLKRLDKHLSLNSYPHYSLSSRLFALHTRSSKMADSTTQSQITKDIIFTDKACPRTAPFPFLPSNFTHPRPF